MSINVKDNFSEITGVSYCLRNEDKKSLTSIVEEMQNSTNEDNLMRLARNMLNTGARNQRIAGNERNINSIIESILDETEVGDIITAESCHELLRNHGIDNEYATVNAIYCALRDLVSDGHLQEKRMRENGGHGYWGKPRYMTVYVVIK